MIVVDAHQDLAWNIATFGRDYSRSVYETRQKENGSVAPQYNGDTLIGYPEYQQGNVAIVFSTLFAAPIRRKQGAWDTECYSDAKHAQKIYKEQADIYLRLVEQHPNKFRLLFCRNHLEDLLKYWGNEKKSDKPVGLVLLMEGAEAVENPQEIAEWWQIGVRIIGPAWAGNRFCGGTGEPGGLTKEGYALLESMADIGFTLDISHMDEKAALQAIDNYPGTMIVSHSNVQALLPGNDSNRFLSDRLLEGLIERNAVIGIVIFNNFLKTGWKRGDAREEVTLDHVVSHIDYICQMAGDANHVGIGSDFDGGFGVQSTPVKIDSVADIQNIIPLLINKGYSDTDVANIMGGNWISYLKTNLPEET